MFRLPVLVLKELGLGLERAGLGLGTAGLDYETGICNGFRELAQRKQRPSIRSPVTYEERMTSGHWLGSALCVAISALTLKVRRHKGHTDHKNPVPPIPSLSSGTDGGGPEEELVQLEKTAAKRKYGFT